MAFRHIPCSPQQSRTPAVAGAECGGPRVLPPALHQADLRPQLRWLRSNIRSAAGSRRPAAFLAAACGRSLEFATILQPGRSGIATASAVGGLGLRERLAGLGLAGVVAYGLLNTLYYTAAFYFVWTYVARVPRGLGFTATCAKFAEVIGVTWAGSQVTKVPRAAGAVVIAPVVDTLLTALQQRAQLRSKHAAFLVVLTACILLAAAFYGTVLLAWA